METCVTKPLTQDARLGILLKCTLLAEGMHITPAAGTALHKRDEGRPPTLADYASTSGITLRIEPDIWVNVPIEQHNPTFVKKPTWRLDWSSGRFVLRSETISVAVDPIPVPAYTQRVFSDGIPYSDYGLTHADRIRISPIAGCSFDCQFCDSPTRRTYECRPVVRFIEVIKAALSDSILPARHILISGGTPKKSDIPYLTKLCAKVAATFPSVQIDVMTIPGNEGVDLQGLHSAGVTGLSLNLEFHDKTIATRYMPKKAAATLASRMEVLERAVRMFGPGQVRSLLLVGIEPIEETVRGVEELARRGVIPVLSPFRPTKGTPLFQYQAPSTLQLLDAYNRSMEVAARYNLTLGPNCVPCQNNTLALGPLTT